jgi:HEAT repeat protein
LSRLCDEDPAGILGNVMNNKHLNARLREDAVAALGLVPTSGAVAQLSGAVKDESWEIRATAVQSLGEIADPASIPALDEALSDENVVVRENAIVALWQIGEMAADSFVKALEDEDPVIRRCAIRGIIEMKRPADAALLAEAVNDPDLEVGRRAITGLGQLGDAASILALISTLQSRHDNLHYDLLRHLAKSTLITIGSPAVPFMTAALDSKSVRVRRGLIQALGEIGDPAAVPSLEKVQENDPDILLRDAAKAAIDKIQRKAR